MKNIEEIHLIYGRLGAKNFVLPVAKSCKGKSIIYCQTENDKFIRKSKKIKDLPKWFNLKISLNAHFFINFFPSCIYLYILLSRNRNSKFIVHMNTFALFPLIIARLARVKKRIYFNHGFPFINEKNHSKLILYLIELTNIFFATDVITVSPKQLLSLKNNFITKIKNIRPIKPGSCCGISKSRIISISEFKKKKANLYLKNKLYLTYIGRPLIRKGFPYIINLFENITELIPEKNVKLQVIGISESMTKNALKDKTKINLIDSISYTNNVDIYLKKSHITILPSTRESFGYALLEGAAQGNALALFDICGPDCLVVDKYNGIIINKKSSSIEFAKNLVNLITNLDKLSFLMTNARKSAFSFNQAKVLKSVRENLDY
tara:strand:- start:551 stop:1681 length:1131 start_codon:yes stop_codon:yes gene_type:complete